MSDRLALPRRYRDQLEALLRQHVPGVEVWAYGSRVNGESHEGSDLDLALRGPGLEPLDGGFYDLLEAIEKSDIPILVQAHDWAMLPESFHREIERDYVVVQEGANRTMAREWRTITLDQLGQVITGKTPSSRRPEYFGGGIQFVTPTDFNGRRLIESTERYLTDKGKNAVAGARIPSGAVMVSCIGSDMGKSTIASQACVTNQQINSIIVDSDNDPRFIYYNLSARREEIRSSAGGSAQPILNKSAFGQLTILLPPLPEQRAIAHVLGTLDDKIELNRRVSETLEAMARALFKSWFVYFEPVRAKMEGRWRPGESLPGLPAALYDLFPDRLVDSELGGIPEGWGVKALGEVAKQRRSGVKPEEIDAESPYIALEHMPKRCIALTQWSNADGLASGKFKFEQGDILFGKLRPYFHKVGVAPLDGVCSTDIVVVQPKSHLWFGFVLGHTSSAEFVDYTDATSAGTRMPRTNWADMARYKVVLPTLEVSKAFTGLVESCVNRIVSAIHESHTLAAQRDALLPGLVSGEVGVGDTEEFGIKRD